MRRLTERMSFSFPIDELLVLDAKARKRGISRSEFIRRATADLFRRDRTSREGDWKPIEK